MDSVPKSSIRKMLRIMGRQEHAFSAPKFSPRVLLDSFEFPITILDRSCKIIDANNHCRNSDWQAAVLGDIPIATGADYVEIFSQAADAGHLKTGDAFIPIRQVCAGSKPSYTVEYSCPSLDDERWFSMTASAMSGQEGGAVVTHSDISEFKRVQARLTESEEKFRLVAGKAPVMIWRASADQRMVYLNDQWLAFTGRQLDQEIENGWLEGIHPDHRVIFEEVFKSAVAKRQSFRLEYRLRGRDGEFRWVLNMGVPLFRNDREFIGFIGSCIDITDRRATEEMLVDLTGRLINAQEDERARIARELHDNLSQKMALLSIEIEQLAQLSPESIDAIQAGLRKVLNKVEEASAEMHRMSYELHPSKLDRLGLAAATLSLCKEISRQQNIYVECKLKDIPSSLPRDISLCLYRVVQESLQNIIKHSGVCSATVELSGSPSEMRLHIADEGVGFKPESVKRKQGLGLLSMHERLRLVGGSMSIESRPMRGTHISAVIPLRAAILEFDRKIQQRGSVREDEALRANLK